MKPPRIGAIDCDIHPALPALSNLLPYLSDHWREMALQAGLHELETMNYPPGAPISARRDWRPAQGKAASTLAEVRAQALDPWETSLAICNCLYGVQALFSEDMAAGIARALNHWMAREWLDREPRLRASIIIPMQSPELAVDEIEFWASDKRFVQVLMLVTGDAPLGRRQYWPIYAAAARHGLPVGIHAGSSFRYPMTPVGWTSYYAEDYVNQSQAFQTQLTSLICEGAFSKYPELRVVLLESGFTWLPTHLWHLSQILARLAHGGALGRPAALRDRARSGAAHASAGRCPAAARGVGAGARAYGLGQASPLFDRLSSLAVRRARMPCLTACRTRSCGRSSSTIPARPIRA